ncbi:MAG: hypothetical protein V1900_01155 [Candidatus Aenigmatarchaeota archaeon]
MVCPKLSRGKCKTLKKTCRASYSVKMIKHKSCRHNKSVSKAKPVKKKKRR